MSDRCKICRKRPTPKAAMRRRQPGAPQTELRVATVECHVRLVITELSKS